MHSGKLHIKVCGLAKLDELYRLEAMGVDFAGMIFYPKSPRCILPHQQAAHARSYQGSMQKVGVFVNASYDEILQAADAYGLQMIQLHGEESPAFCHELRKQGLKIIKVFPVSGEGFPDTRPYEASCDYFLFDTASQQKGGTGKRFDWRQLHAYQGSVPFFLSGGIGPEHAAEILSLNHPRLYAVDINSRFETAPGIKDFERIKRFICQLNTVSEV